jgi:hypothetical protein
MLELDVAASIQLTGELEHLCFSCVVPANARTQRNASHRIVSHRIVGIARSMPQCQLVDHAAKKLQLLYWTFSNDRIKRAHKSRPFNQRPRRIDGIIGFELGKRAPDQLHGRTELRKCDSDVPIGVDHARTKLVERMDVVLVDVLPRQRTDVEQLEQSNTTFENRARVLRKHATRCLFRNFDRSTTCHGGSRSKRDLGSYGKLHLATSPDGSDPRDRARGRQRRRPEAEA